MVEYRFLRAIFYPEFTACKATVLCIYSTRKTNKQESISSAGFHYYNSCMLRGETFILLK